MRKYLAAAAVIVSIAVIAIVISMISFRADELALCSTTSVNPMRAILLPAAALVIAAAVFYKRNCSDKK